MIDFPDTQVRERLIIDVQPIPSNSQLATRERVYEPSRIEVLPAGSNEPVLVRDRGDLEYRPTDNSATKRPPHGKPHNLPPVQTQISKNGNVKSNHPHTPTGSKNPFLAPTGRTYQEEKAFADLVNGVIVGVYDELVDKPISDRFDVVNPVGNTEFYWGYNTARPVTDFVQDTVDNVVDFVDDLKDNLPDWGLPEFDLPNFDLPQIDPPKVDLPNPFNPELPQTDLPPNNQPTDQPNGQPKDEPFNLPNNFKLPDWLFDFLPEPLSDLFKEPQPEPEPQPSNEPSIEDLVDNIKDQLPEYCTAEVFFASHRKEFYDIPHYDFRNRPREVTEWKSGTGGVNYKPERDLHGNSYPVFFESEGWGGGANQSFYTGGIGPAFITESTRTTARVAVHFINRNTDTTSLFRYKVYTPEGTYYYPPDIPRVDIENFGLIGLRVSCYVDVTFPPINPFLPPTLPPLPPKPPDMGCECSDIARILKLTMQSMKFLITVPIVACEYEGEENDKSWVTKVTYRDIEVFAVDIASATAQAELYRQLATQAVEICEAKNLTDKSAKAIGVDEYPATLPSSLITKDGNDPGEIEVSNLTNLLGWYIERFDEIMGQWEIPIEIKDTDPTTPGDQSKILKFPNIAETLAEMTTLLLQLSINSEMHTTITTRTMLEAGQDKRQNFISYKMLHAIVEYLGFSYDEKKVKLPLLFTPEKEDFADILKESEIEVPVIDFNEKYTLQADLARFKEAAGIIKAIHFQKLNPNADIKQQLMQKLLGLSGLLDDTKAASEDDSDNFDEFLNAVELGFTNTPGVGDPTKPYGRDYEDRPRVRRFKKVDADDPAT